MSSTAAIAGAPPAKKSKLLPIAGLAVVLAAGGAGGAWWWAKNQHKAAAGQEAAKPVENKPRVFSPLDPFTVNLRKTDADHFLQIGITFETTSAAVGDAIKNNTPLIRSRVLYLLTSKSAEEISSTEGKIKLAGELLTLVRAALAGVPASADAGADGGLTDVHFASFIIQ